MFQVVRILGWPNIVRGKGYLREVRQEDQQQHRERRDYELARHYEGDGHECRLQDGPADLVDDPRQNALIDCPPLLDQRYDVRQPSISQNDACGAFGHVGRGTDGDSHFSLTKCGRIVDAIARHAGHVSSGL